MEAPNNDEDDEDAGIGGGDGDLDDEEFLQMMEQEAAEGRMRG